MKSIKLSENMVSIPLNQQKAVTVQKIQRNMFEVKVRFITLSGIIVKSFVCSNSEVDNWIADYARQYNYKIVK